MGHLASMQTLGKVHLIWQGGDEDIEDGLQKFLDTWKGGSEKIRGGGSKNLYASKPTGGGGLLNKWAASEGELLKFQASSFNMFIPPLVILNELSLTLPFNVGLFFKILNGNLTKIIRLLIDSKFFTTKIELVK